MHTLTLAALEDGADGADLAETLKATVFVRGESYRSTFRLAELLAIAHAYRAVPVGDGRVWASGMITIVADRPW